MVITKKKKKKCCQGARFGQRIWGTVEPSHPNHPLPSPPNTHGVEKDYSGTHWKSEYTQRIKKGVWG